jgi:very-short-patch-repair endonuclease
MPSRNIIIGQKVDPALLERAKELRKHMTPEEGIVWQRLRANRLGGWHFRRQQVIAGFIVDFYCHQAGLVVELDGPVHERQEEYDDERDTILESQGLRVLRIKNTEVHQDLELVLERILEAYE